MLRNFFKNIARKLTESELDNIISRFSSDDPEAIFMLHDSAKTGPGAWRALLTDDCAELFDKICHIENGYLDEDSKKKIATSTCAFIQLQRNSNEEHTIFCFWFWKVIFNTMLFPELDNKTRGLFNLIQKQSDQYHSEFIRRAEEIMGQKAEIIELNEEAMLYHVLPRYYKN